MARGRVHARNQRQRSGDSHGHEREGHGQGQAFKHEIEHRRAVGVTVAHVAHNQSADPVPVPQARRLVQPQLGGQRCDSFRGGIRAHENLCSVAGQNFQHQKNDDGGADQCCNERDKTLEKEKAHGWVVKNEMDAAASKLMCIHSITAKTAASGVERRSVARNAQGASAG